METKELSDERIEEIKRLRAGISPCYANGEDNPIDEYWARDVSGLNGPADAAFIAASPTIVDDLLADREELIGLLADVEWREGELGDFRCPICGNSQKRGHTADCTLAVALQTRGQP